MKTPHRLPRVTWVLVLAGLILSGIAGVASARRTRPAKDGAGAPAGSADGAGAPRAAVPPGAKLNACGCYRRGESCVCTNRNARCECPEDCEPIGCDEKRQKEMDREVAAEMKRALYEDQKRQDAEKEAQREAEARERKASGDDSDEEERPAETGKTKEAAADEVLDQLGGGKTQEKEKEKAPVKPVKTPRKGKTRK